jgi:hypothetical protein
VLPSTGVGSSAPGSEFSWQLWLILVLAFGGSGAFVGLAYYRRTSREL